jgi:hypothetical protein
VLVGLFLMVLVLLSGCDNKPENNIQWQLPLQAPEDVHVSDLHAVLPAWAAAREGRVDLVFLHKNTARKSVVSVVKGQPATFKGWQVRVLGLAQGLRIKSGAFLDDESVHNAAAFVELLRDDKLMYRGWLYQEFPELFGLDDAGWKIWLKDVSIQPVLLKNEKNRLP